MKVIVTLLAIIFSHNAIAAGDAVAPYAQQDWSFNGMTGKFDKQSIQRGYQVYKEVCSSCHGMKQLSYRNLGEIGFSEDEIKAIAGEYTCVHGVDESGDPKEEPCVPADKFVSPFANENAARASNGGAYPPDLSLMTKARGDGANYVYALLADGYKAKTIDDLRYIPFPEVTVTIGGKSVELKKADIIRLLDSKEANQKTLSLVLDAANALVPEGQYWNKYFPGGLLAMAPPISADLVEYQDGTNASLEQLSADLVNFLQWAAEPEMEVRKSMGIKTLIFFVFFTLLFYVVKKRTWANVKKK